MKCPYCGNNNIAKILYGKPVLNEKLENDISDGNIVLGGCCITGDGPKYRCNKCEKRFGSPAIIYGNENCRINIIAGIRILEFTIGGFFNGVSSIFFDNDGQSINLVVNNSRSPYSDHFERRVSAEEWDKLTNKLFNDLFVHEWSKKYSNNDILDGTQWTLNIETENDYRIHIYGSNEYPALWSEFKSIVWPYFKEAGLLNENVLKLLNYRRAIELGCIF